MLPTIRSPRHSAAARAEFSRREGVHGATPHDLSWRTSGSGGMPPSRVGGFCPESREIRGKTRKTPRKSAALPPGTPAALSLTVGRSVGTPAPFGTVADGQDQGRAGSRGGLPMGSSAFEVIFVPVLLGTFQGIVAGTAILTLWNAVVALVGRLGRVARSIEAVHRAARTAPRPVRRPIPHGARS